MSKLLYFILIFAALFIVKSYFSIWAAIGAVVLIILFISWKKRAGILTTLASRAYFGVGDAEKGEKYYKMAYDTGLMTANDKIAYS